ncbi:hypothetical protein [Sphingomonas bacterium]|uniref:hypothetical protein n=1 Tax=Sphingomonas bacterium TaxID=1895847 RepID=UPI0015751807|nr:hypothetical protein [Sphingomonas bacterium]
MTSMGLWGGINCLLGRHVRSRGQAKATPAGWTSRCARCAIPMTRPHGGGKWKAVKRRKRGEDEALDIAQGELIAEAIVERKKRRFRKSRTEEPNAEE